MQDCIRPIRVCCLNQPLGASKAIYVLLDYSRGDSNALTEPACMPIMFVDSCNGVEALHGFATRGGQAWNSPNTCKSCLMLRSVGYAFKLPTLGNRTFCSVTQRAQLGHFPAKGWLTAGDHGIEVHLFCLREL